jgi:hypothetical protein
MHALPHLGASFIDVAHALGSPTHTTTANGGVVRRYRSALGTLTVVFERGRSIAMHVPHHVLPLHSTDTQTLRDMLYPSDGTACRLLVHDGGWLLGTHEYPADWLKSLSALHPTDGAMA